MEGVGRPALGAETLGVLTGAEGVDPTGTETEGLTGVPTEIDEVGAADAGTDGVIGREGTTGFEGVGKASATMEEVMLADAVDPVLEALSTPPVDVTVAFPVADGLAA